MWRIDTDGFCTTTLCGDDWEADVSVTVPPPLVTRQDLQDEIVEALQDVQDYDTTTAREARAVMTVLNRHGLLVHYPETGGGEAAAPDLSRGFSVRGEYAETVSCSAHSRSVVVDIDDRIVLATAYLTVDRARELIANLQAAVTEAAR